MKLYKSSFIALALAAGVTSCTDYLEQEPPSSLTPENFYTSEDQVQAVANRFYQDIMPGHGGWDYGTYTNDNNTDVQAARADPRPGTRGDTADTEQDILVDRGGVCIRLLRGDQSRRTHSRL